MMIYRHGYKFNDQLSKPVTGLPGSNRNINADPYHPHTEAERDASKVLMEKMDTTQSYGGNMTEIIRLYGLNYIQM